MKYYRIDFKGVKPITEAEYLNRYNNDSRAFIMWYNDGKNCFIGASNCATSTVIKAVTWITGEYHLENDWSGSRDFCESFSEFLRY